MPKLDNPAHEAFVQTLVHDPETKFNQTKSYDKVYPDSNLDSSRSSAPVVLAIPRVKERLDEVMDRAGLTNEYLTSKLYQHTGSRTESISLEATKFGMKGKGFGADENGAGKHQHLHIHEAEAKELSPEARVNKIRQMIRGNA